MQRHGWATPPRVIAHRGASREAPENTLAALGRAVELEAPAVEFDVQLTADGVPVLLHDETLDRTTPGRGAVGTWPADAVGKLDAGSWFDPRFSGERVPTLEAALDLLGGRALLDVELKTPTPAPRLVAQVAEALDRRGLAEDAVLSSFLPETVQDAAGRGLPSALILVGELAPEEFAACADYSDAFGIWEGGLSPEGIASCRAIGVPVYAWTVDDASRASALLAAGAAGIITNDPRLLLQALPRKEESGASGPASSPWRSRP